MLYKHKKSVSLGLKLIQNLSPTQLLTNNYRHACLWGKQWKLVQIQSCYWPVHFNLHFIVKVEELRLSV